MANDAELAELVRMLPALRRLVVNDDTLATAAGLGTKLTTNDAQTITGEKTFKAVLRIQDGSGNLIHAFGTKS